MMPSCDQSIALTHEGQHFSSVTSDIVCHPGVEVIRQIWLAHFMVWYGMKLREERFESDLGTELFFSTHKRHDVANVVMQAAQAYNKDSPLR
jgi:hypothetical protein